MLGWCASCQDKAAIAQLLLGMQGGAAAPERARQDDAAAKAARSFERALALWNGSEPVPGTLAATYLSFRGLPHLATSPALRFRPDCPHPSRCRLPALVAMVVGPDGGPVGIHRTFLAHHGFSKTDIQPPRAALGQMHGGVIRLDPVAGEICIGEGIESSASAGLLLKLPAWAAISAGNLEHSLLLPPQVRSVAIAADPDEPGRRAANAAWHRWNSEGRRVRINTPKVGRGDFNEILQRRVAGKETE